MSLVRRHLRRGVVAWLVCHVLTFTALVPRDCCAAHAHAAVAPSGASHHAAAAAPADAPPCHEMGAEAPAPAPEPAMGDHCDMPASDGAACPMHRAGAPAAGCAMTGVCHAPDAALAAVLWPAAVTPVTPALPLPAVATVPPLAVATSSIALAVPPDAPPPRS